MQSEVVFREPALRTPRQEAWDRFVGLHARQVEAAVRQAARSVGGAAERDELEDLTQEVYCRLLQRDSGELPELDHPARRFVYLRRVARSVIIDRRRAGAAKKRGRGRLILSWDSVEIARQRDAVDSAATPEERLLLRERSRDLLASCRRILRGRRAERNLRIVRLAWVEGWNSREISKRLEGELAPSSIDTLLSRVRKRLLEERGTARRRPGVSKAPEGRAASRPRDVAASADRACDRIAPTCCVSTRIRTATCTRCPTGSRSAHSA
jgi:RNA polymerase sigma factor (sigma-70 family)